MNLNVATWNTRGLGAEAGEIDQELKMTSILERMRIQKWDVVGLTDLKYREDGVRKYRHAGQDRFLVVSGRVGFLMSESWHSWWQAGGRWRAVRALVEGSRHSDAEKRMAPWSLS